MRTSNFMRVLLLLLAACTLACFAWAAEPGTAAASSAPWVALGPDGGDVRSLAYDPRNPDRIFLGTSAGQLYFSRDAGSSWTRLAHLGEGDDYVLDNMAVDPEAPDTLYVAAWSVERNSGDVFRSRDGGRSWQALPGIHGKSIRAFVLAPSRPRVLVAGALDGIYRSDDGGDTWRRISPVENRELRNVESLAVDPRTPDIIYAGTWHLPWKTYDGGRTWQSIKDGIVDDSDVFSIIVDRTNPMVVYLSACSGIYKSRVAGHGFQHIQGIPAAARRTRVLQQDPQDPSVIYAGTTEGLWKTTDAGATWTRTTSANLVINDVLIDPRHPSRVLLATDRAGVLASRDAGRSFVASSNGFTHRQVSALVVDRAHPGTFYAGLVNDKEFGGVYITHDGGGHWQQSSEGLEGRDIFSLQQAANGDLIAGTNRGVFRLARGESRWHPASLVLTQQKSVDAHRPRMQRGVVRSEWVKSELNARVAQLAFTPTRWFAATSQGLYRSLDQGASWNGGAILGSRNFLAVDAWHDTVLASTGNAVLLSTDGGSSWKQCRLPDYAVAISSVAVAPGGLWVVSRDGAFHSQDLGKTWTHVIVGPPARNLAYVSYDPIQQRLLGIAANSGLIYQSRNGSVWERLADAGAPIRGIAVSGSGMLAITPFSGILSPGMPESRLAESPAGSETASPASPRL